MFILALENEFPEIIYINLICRNMGSKKLKNRLTNTKFMPKINFE